MAKDVLVDHLSLEWNYLVMVDFGKASRTDFGRLAEKKDEMRSHWSTNFATHCSLTTDKLDPCLPLNTCIISKMTYKVDGTSQLQGRIAIVTGPSLGMGRAIAHSPAKEGGL